MACRSYAVRTASSTRYAVRGIIRRRGAAAPRRRGAAKTRGTQFAVYRVPRRNPRRGIWAGWTLEESLPRPNAAPLGNTSTTICHFPKNQTPIQGTVTMM